MRGSNAKVEQSPSHPAHSSGTFSIKRGSTAYLPTENPTQGRLFQLKRSSGISQTQYELDHFYYLVVLGAGWVFGRHGHIAPVTGTTP
jgi:hypothetical protein